jgi:glutaminyl-peptide cyclotransferase
MSNKRTRIIAIILLALFGSLFFFRSCEPGKDNRPKGGTPQRTEPAVKVSVPEFQRDSAMAFLRKQVEFGPRVPNSASHRKAGDWLAQKLRSYGANVIEQQAGVEAWDGTTLRMRNIIAEINPEARKRVVLAAHWDTRPYADKDPDAARQKMPIDGANDGASGVAVLLEIARLLQAQPVPFGVDLILFDAEDYGRPEWDGEDTGDDYLFWCLGSQYWEKNLHRPGYQAMFGILLDMVGGKDARFNREGISMQVAPDVVNKVWKTAADLGYAELFQEPVTGEIIDDHIFMNRAGVRTIDIIDMRPSTKAMGFGGYQFGSTHHTHADNLESIDPSVLEAVGKTVTHVLYHVK